MYSRDFLYTRRSVRAALFSFKFQIRIQFLLGHARPVSVIHCEEYAAELRMPCIWTRTQVEPAARNAFRWHASIPPHFFSLHGIWMNFVLIVCFYSIAGLSEESIYHTRKFSLHANCCYVVFFTDFSLFPPRFLLSRLLLRTLVFPFLFFFTERRFVFAYCKAKARISSRQCLFTFVTECFAMKPYHVVYCLVVDHIVIMHVYTDR